MTRLDEIARAASAFAVIAYEDEQERLAFIVHVNNKTYRVDDKTGEILQAVQIDVEGKADAGDR